MKNSDKHFPGFYCSKWIDDLLKPKELRSNKCAKQCTECAVVNANTRKGTKKYFK